MKLDLVCRQLGCLGTAEPGLEMQCKCGQYMDVVPVVVAPSTSNPARWHHVCARLGRPGGTRLPIHPSTMQVTSHHAGLIR